MAKVVYVTEAQKIAAQMIVERNTARGMTVPPAISMIANASAELDGGPEVTRNVDADNKSRTTGTH